MEMKNHVFEARRLNETDVVWECQNCYKRVKEVIATSGCGNPQEFDFVWNCSKFLPERRGMYYNVVGKNNMNQMAVEFEDGFRTVYSMTVLKRRCAELRCRLPYGHKYQHQETV